MEGGHRAVEGDLDPGLVALLERGAREVAARAVQPQRRAQEVAQGLLLDGAPELVLEEAAQLAAQGAVPGATPLEDAEALAVGQVRIVGEPPEEPLWPARDLQRRGGHQQAARLVQLGAVGPEVEGGALRLAVQHRADPIRDEGRDPRPRIAHLVGSAVALLGVVLIQLAPEQAPEHEARQDDQQGVEDQRRALGAAAQADSCQR